MNTKYKIRMTKGNAPIQKKDKQSYKMFCRFVWISSETNLHFIDFCNVHELSLKEIYTPFLIEVE